MRAVVSEKRPKKEVARVMLDRLHDFVNNVVFMVFDGCGVGTELLRQCSNPAGRFRQSRTPVDPELLKCRIGVAQIALFVHPNANAQRIGQANGFPMHRAPVTVDTDIGNVASAVNFAHPG